LLEQCPPHLRQWEWNYLNHWFGGSQSEVLEINSTPSQVASVAFNRDGSRLAAAYDNWAVRIWDVPSRKVVRTLYTRARPAAVAVGPDETTLAVSENDSSVTLWDPTKGRLKGTLRGHERTADEVVFSRDGQLLASSGQDGLIKVWDMTGRD